MSGYNHYFDCDCGWCVKDWDYSELRRNWSEWSYHSYTVPNAKCPVCSASVFFYQSPFGGRVFFDDLGPPWPKHPCTDSSNPFGGSEPNDNREEHNLVKPKWQEEGWKPFIFVSGNIDHEIKMTQIHGIPPEEMRLRVMARKSVHIDYTNYFQAKTYHTPDEGYILYLEGTDWFVYGKWIFTIYPFFIREISVEEGRFELASFSLTSGSDIKTISFSAYMPKSSRRRV